MRDNLVFYNIPEEQDEKWREYCYNVKFAQKCSDEFYTHTCGSGSKSTSLDPTVQTEQCPTQASNLSTTTTSVWNRQSTLLLIQCYKEYQEAINKGKIRKKVVWARISTKLDQKGYKFTSDQVCGRWKSLMRAYKNTKDHNNKSGNDTKTYEYEDDLDDLFKKDPVIQPKFTLESQEKPGASTPTKEELKDTDNDDRDEDATSCSEDNTTPSTRKKTRKVSDEYSIVKVFNSYIDEQREDRKRKGEMHRERMEMMSSLVEALRQSGGK